MVLLLTGASHVGKTLLAQKLLEKYHYPYLSIDHLKMGLIRSGYTTLNPLSSDEELTAYLWPVVREIIKTAIENDQNLIVEGCYVPFDWAKDFDEADREKIQYRCLVMSEEYLRSHFDQVKQYANAIEKRGCDEYSLEDALADHAKILKQAEEKGCDAILIEEEYDLSPERVGL